MLGMTPRGVTGGTTWIIGQTPSERADGAVVGRGGPSLLLQKLHISSFHEKMIHQLIIV
jgi:hypothetical protein